MKKVLIGGVYYGLHNIGDEAILESIIETFRADSEISVKTFGSDWLKQKFPEVKTYAINEKYEKPKMGIYEYPRRPMRQLLRSARNSFFPDLSFYRQFDLYLCGGATILSDCPWYSLRTAQLAIKAGVPVVVWGVGMAEVDDVETKKYIRDVLNNKGIVRICIRDQYVKERLVRIGVIESKIDIVYDPALIIKPEPFQLGTILPPAAVTGLSVATAKNICISISGEEDVIGRTPIEEIKKFISNITSKHDCTVYLLPTGFGAQCKDVQLLKGLAINESTHLIEKELTPGQLAFFTSKMEAIVSSRLHANILSTISGTPSLGLMRNEKLKDFARLLGEQSIPLEDINADSLEEWVLECIRANKARRSAILESYNAMVAAHKRIAKEISSLYLR